MKTTVLHIFCLLFMSTGSTFAQKISLFELQNIFANKTFDSTNKLLLSKNFEFSKTEKTEDNKIAISWNFDQNNEDKLKTLASFQIISLDGVIQKAAYEFRGKEIYANILGELTKFEFQTDKEEIENEKFTISYSNSSFYMKISFKKSVDEAENLNNSYISYMINISKKGGADDPYNGLKTDFFLNGKPKCEYTLKDGKMNGVIKYFNENGTISKIGQMVLGIAKGTFTTFVYNKTGNVIRKEVGEMRDGKKTGIWLVKSVNSDIETNLSHTNYVNDLKEGSFSRMHNDSISFGNYKNNLLDGAFRTYSTAIKTSGDEIIETDTLKLKKVIVGFYINDKKHGLWKNYDVDGTLVSEGTYENNKKTGTWTKFYRIYLDKDDKETEYSGKPYLIENYKNGKLHGSYKRLSTLNEIQYPCEDNPNNKCTRIDFKENVESVSYEYGLMSGKYESVNDKNLTIESGIYVSGKRTGKWELVNDSKVIAQNKNSIESGNYVNDKKQDKWTRFVDGKVAEIYFYKDDLLHGEHQVINDLKPTDKRTFVNGDLTDLLTVDNNLKPIAHYVIKTDTDGYTCEKTDYLKNEIQIKNYTVKNIINKSDDYSDFKNDFEKAEKVADGFYQRKTADDKMIEEGRFANNMKFGKWISFHYDQKLKTEFQYNSRGEIVEELYIDIKKNELFDGEFQIVYENGSGLEERKIKSGKRNGTTKYKDASGKLIKKETYEAGVLKSKE